MFIASSVFLSPAAAVRNGAPLPPAGPAPEDHYHSLARTYPRFFKMDLLCKWAWLGAEYLVEAGEQAEISKDKTGIILATGSGCVDVDKRYLEGIAHPSPALFVYTLPNIMLGEISIRHGYKGEQLCLVAPWPDCDTLCFNAHTMLHQKGMEACIAGWADAPTAAAARVCLFFIQRTGPGIACTPAALRQLCATAGMEC